VDTQFKQIANLLNSVDTSQQEESTQENNTDNIDDIGVEDDGTREQTIDDNVSDNTDNISDNADYDEQQPTPESDDDNELPPAATEFPTTLNELADQTEISLEELYSLNVKMPDGEDPIKLGDLKNKYTEQKRENTKLSEQINNTTAQAQQAQQISTEKATVYGQLAELQRQGQLINWKELEDSDPGQAALQKQKYNEAIGTLNSRLHQIDTYEKQVSNNQLQQAASQTLQLIPEWSNQETRLNDVREIESSLLNEGYSHQEISSIRDPRALKLFKELIGLRKQNKDANKLVDKVRKAPKPLRNSSRNSVNKKNNTQTLVKKARNTGHKNDELAAAKAVLGL